MSSSLKKKTFADNLLTPMSSEIKVFDENIPGFFSIEFFRVMSTDS